MHEVLIFIFYDVIHNFSSSSISDLTVDSEIGKGMYKTKCGLMIHLYALDILSPSHSIPWLFYPLKCQVKFDYLSEKSDSILGKKNGIFSNEAAMKIGGKKIFQKS